ncbi:MAG: hypothetical protein ACW99J_18715 [Candidatus Thorarchaeota archaeon]|jgi:hypothetical protein
MEFKFDDEPKRDEEEEVKSTRNKRGRGRSKAAKSKSVSGRKATSEPEVKPVDALESIEDFPDPESFAETTGSGVIPPAPEREPGFVGDTERVIVRSAWPSRLIVTNTPSGEVYEFEQAGTLLSVNAADVQYLLSQNRTNARGCCGSGHDKIKFELAY